MPHTLARAQPAGQSPLRVLLLVLALVFAVETAIMLTLDACPWLSASRWTRAIADPLALTVFITPALWVLVVRPLRLAIQERGEFVGRLLRVQEEERARLSRDLHDDLGQQLTAVLLRLNALDHAADLPSARGHAADAAAIVSETVDSVRRLARGLGPPALSGLGLRAALERLCEDLASASGLDIRHEITLAPGARFAPQTEITVYRIVQEACTNIVRHAHAAHVRLALSEAAGTLRVQIADDGQGFGQAARASRSGPLQDEPSRGPGLGLTGMRERVLALGGELEIDSSPAHGTTITARIPAAPSLE